MGATKHPDDRVRRNKEHYDEDGFRIPQGRAAGAIQSSQQIEMPEWDGVVRGKPLPNSHPSGGTWHPATRKWWNMWRRSPQAMFAIESDWESLLIAALIHHRIMDSKQLSHTAMVGLTGELRKREGLFGGTLEDRIRLNMSNPKPSVDNAAEEEIQTAAIKGIDYLERMNREIAKRKTTNPGG